MTRTLGRYGFARGSVSPLFFLILALLSLHSEGNGGAQEPAYLDSLLARSDQLRLHDDPYWWILLHCKKYLFGVRSLVDDPDFFLAEDRKHNPRGELEPSDLLEKGLDLEAEVRILDLVMECVQVQYTKEELTKEEYVERFLEASKARSSLGRQEGYGYDIPAPSRPEQGHKPGRLSIGVGYRAWDDLDEGRLYQEIRFRPTYHDLLDSDKGYSPGGTDRVLQRGPAILQFH